MDLREVFERQNRRIYRLAMLYLKNVADAEDAVQNVFLKYIEKEVFFEDVARETAWFIAVTRNYCKDQLRSFWKKRVDMGEIPEPVTWEKTDYELYEQIMKLPDKYREVLYLYYYEDYSVREMADILSRNGSTIQTQLADARKKLKSELEKEESKWIRER